MSGPLPPRVLQLVGLVLVLASFASNLITGRFSVEFLSAGMTLVTLGSFWNGPRPPGDYELPPSHGQLPKATNGRREESP